ncbi:MAG: D-alanyl-D-alanine carboxypeptidase [Clostridiales bacterium]|nr:D-alanyl-D-alanine carboxypeptidase [Candidatus Equinaster intestinalis]
MEYPAEDLDVPLETSDAVPTAANITELKIAAKSAVLMEVKTGEILYESNIDEKTPPASITKIMSLLLIMEAIEQGKLSYETTVTASEHACSMGGSQIWLETGEQMTVDELLKAAVIASANDATVALGEAVAGSEEGFVAMMNERAEKLGMSSTHFENCTGLDAENHYSTAHDVAIMSCELLKHKDIRKYSTVWMDTLRDGKSELVNTNKLVRFYEGCTGLKTGTTSTAGYCLSASAEKNGMELVAVIMDADKSTERFEAAKKLLNYGYANFIFTEISADLGENPQVRVKKGVKSSVGASQKENFNLLLSKNAAGDIKQMIEIKDEITAPVKKGDLLGFAKVFKGEEQVGVIEIVANEDVKKLDLIICLGILLKNLVCL